MVIAYRMPAFSAWLMRRKKMIPWVGLPNILAGEFLVPELLQEQATPAALADALGALRLKPGRAGHKLAWAPPETLEALVQPVAAVFYPVAVLPQALQHVSQFIPAAHVFEGMRTAAASGEIAWGRLALASAENVVYLALASLLVAWVFRLALRRGLLPKVH